jgi:trimethylamine:corrinoid methyltransferase-like protein
LAEALAAGWSVRAGVEEVVLGAAGMEESFMKINLEKLTVHTVYTVDFP